MSGTYEPPRTTTATDRTRRDARDVVKGFFCVLGLHVVGCAVLWLLSLLTMSPSGGDLPMVLGAAPLFLGAVQVLWVAPLVVRTRRDRPGVAQGALIAAAITFFLNAACWGLLLGVVVVNNGGVR